MKAIKIIGFGVLILLGAFMVVFGEYDDSPGLQGLGIIITITGVVFTFKRVRKK
ncbi:MAG: hypothetical protein KBC62_03470 [Candidatus Pacebacteria bacterium]|nr:hypothetical protein [Candidatus Paceibacterota bacterium]MBP9843038.1 hypothetical protein [Candidatus Paceibacterota bacterium]